ncbi:GL13918 [Drosophila persimilis]|uniref:GL13918 n=1 Tax=Drosophila persimilis TaxID=7234 RepID=B4GN05_DROPE|nr:GL13918 [Drosophila persimilis]
MTKNGVIIAGYCVEGPLAKIILSEPEEIATLSVGAAPQHVRRHPDLQTVDLCF